MTRSNSKKSVDGISRRRKDRANVAGRLNGVYVRCDRLARDRELIVFNISEFGMGVDATHVKQAPGASEVLEAKLLVGTTAAPVKIRLVHMGTQIMGMEFVEPTGLLRGAIQHYFEPELSGASLRAVGSALAAPGKTAVYESKDGSRLEIEVAGPGTLGSFSISVLGNEVTWDSGAGLKLQQYGRTDDVPEFLLKQLAKFVRSADQVDAALRGQVHSVLNGTYQLKQLRRGGGAAAS